MRRFRRCPRVAVGTAEGLIEALEARGPLSRLLGLAGLGEPPPHALLMPRCRCVHTWGMRFAIDVVFAAPVGDRTGLRVLAVRSGVPPRRLVALGREHPPGTGLDLHPECRVPAPLRRRDVAVLELPAGMASRLRLRPGALLAPLIA